MKLTLITENNQILQQTAEKLNISIDELNKLLTDADPTGRKYKLFILKLLNKNDIRLPEDNYRIKETLNNFQKYQRNLAIKDILKYNSLHELETVLEPVVGSISKRQGGNNLNPSKLPGVELINQTDTNNNVVNNYLDPNWDANAEWSWDGFVQDTVNNYKTYKVTDVESLKDIGEGTKWCTRRSYPDCQAEYYIEQYGWIGVIYKDGKPFVQFTPDYDQVMDVNDRAIDNKTIIDLVPKPGLDSNPIDLYHYAKKFIKDRWPEAEPFILQDDHTAFKYAVDVVRGRWREAEHIMLKKPSWASMYAQYCLHHRWPRGESVILQDNKAILNYIKYTFKPSEVKNGWPAAEPKILTSPEYTYLYACDVLGKRWPEGEPVLLRSPQWAYYYACDVLGKRWPEAEPIIFSVSHFREGYKNSFDL